MTELAKITIESSTRLTLGQELAVNRAAVARHPESRQMRTRLAALLLQADLFEDVIELLDGRQATSFDETMMLMQALLSAENHESNLRVREIAETAIDLAQDDNQRAAAMADKAKALIRLGDDSAQIVLEQALALDPDNKNACKRLATLLLNSGNPEAVLEFTRRCEAQGASHSRLYAAQILSLARLGRIAEARRLDGREEFGMVCQLEPPPGWDSIETFNEALARQMLDHPALRYERYGTASEKTWRVDAPNTGHAPLVDALLRQISETASTHLEKLKNSDHPWARSAPDKSILHCWCVITEGTGYETWHVHQFGWLSGVYYVAMPEDINSMNMHGGCLVHGLPPEIVGEKAAEEFGSEIVRPAAGQMRLFPSHCYHSTIPHHAEGKRICIAYDFWPALGT